MENFLVAAVEAFQRDQVVNYDKWDFSTQGLGTEMCPYLHKESTFVL